MLGRNSDQFRVAAIEKRSAGNINFFLASLHATLEVRHKLSSKVFALADRFTISNPAAAAGAAPKVWEMGQVARFLTVLAEPFVPGTSFPAPSNGVAVSGRRRWVGSTGFRAASPSL
jgi:hypothetical protein